MLSVLCGTLRDVSTRRLDVAISPLIIMMLSQIVVAASGLGCWVFETWKMPDLSELLALAFASVFSLVGHLFVIYSLRSGEMAAVAPFRYAGILWAILLGLLIWNQLPDALSLAGICILVRPAFTRSTASRSCGGCLISDLRGSMHLVFGELCGYMHPVWDSPRLITFNAFFITFSLHWGEWCCVRPICQLVTVRVDP